MLDRRPGQEAKIKELRAALAELDLQDKLKKGSANSDSIKVTWTTPSRIYFLQLHACSNLVGVETGRSGSAVRALYYNGRGPRVENGAAVA
jgi:hypothetical protein